MQKVRVIMTKEQKNKIFKKLEEDKNDFARECEKRITTEEGKIIGANYMFRRFIDILNTEIEPKETIEE